MNIILYDAFYLLSNAFNTYIIYSFMNLFFKKECINRKFFIFLYAIFYLATTITYVFLSVPILNLIITVLSLFVVTFSYKSRLSKKIISTILVYLTTFVCEAIVALIFGITGTSPFLKEQYGDIFCLVIVELITLSFVRIISHFHNINNEIPVPGLFVVISIVVPAISVFFEIQVCMQKSISDFMYFVSLICILALNFMMLYLYDVLAKFFNEKIQSNLSKQRELYYKNQSEVIQQSYENTKQMQHDLKNYTIALTELLKNNENEKALEYISSIAGKLEISGNYCKTGIIAIDSIINYKLAMANKMGISVNFECSIPNNISLNSDDLVAILGNILDNSIEAAKKAENKYINFYFGYDKGTTIILLKNSYNGNIKKVGNNYKTTKHETSEAHGIGLSSVKTIVKKYNGEMLVNHNQTEFFLKIILLS